MPKPGRLKNPWLLACIASAGIAAAAAAVQRGEPPHPPPPLPEPQGAISSELGRPGRPMLVDPTTGLPIAPADAQRGAPADADALAPVERSGERRRFEREPRRRQ